MTKFLLVTVLAAVALAQPAPVTYVAGARFHVNDLRKAREFYSKVLGFQERRGAGEGLAAFQINADQDVEFSAGEAGASHGPLELLRLGTSEQRAPLQDPDGRRVEFTAKAARARSFKPGGDSISDHLLHVGLDTPDLKRAGDFYTAQFGFKEIWRGPTPTSFQIAILKAPGPREDWVEFLIHRDGGWKDHICLDVPDIQRAYQALVERGAAGGNKPRIASNGHWVLNLSDPNGIRVELMEPNPAAK
jgi:catechol 2,3-dioxygenase-like lactoylglutathione lyase family enzyme